MPASASSNFFKNTAHRMRELCGTLALTEAQQAQREETHKIYEQGLAVNEQINDLEKRQVELMQEARDRGNERAERWLGDKFSLPTSLFRPAKQQPAQETYASALAINGQIQELKERQEKLMRQASRMGSAKAQDWMCSKYPIFGT